MASLVELKSKYGLGDGAKYEPFSGCKFCKGTGEKLLVTRPGQVSFCICLFVDHSMSNFAGETLGQVARKLKQELEPDHVD